MPHFRRRRFYRPDEPNSNGKMAEAKEGIHSGHFMISDPHNAEDSEPGTEPASRDDADSVAVELQSGLISEAAPSPSTAGRATKAIDASLAKLFECMSLAYSGKLTSPKWKNFKGMKLKWKDKIRLNNVIWRCWHIQYIKNKNPIICQFSIPSAETEVHAKPKAVVLEGMYWKRKLETCIAEYKRWRTFSRNRRLSETDEFQLLQRVGNSVPKYFAREERWHKGGYNIATTVAQAADYFMEDELMDFSDTLFSTLNQPYSFPNFREMNSQIGNADIIQPGLVQLQPQPNLEDLMDFEPLHEMLDKTVELVNNPSLFAEELGVFLSSQQRGSDPNIYTGDFQVNMGTLSPEYVELASGDNVLLASNVTSPSSANFSTTSPQNVPSCSNTSQGFVSIDDYNAIVGMPYSQSSVQQFPMDSTPSYSNIQLDSSKYVPGTMLQADQQYGMTPVRTSPILPTSQQGITVQTGRTTSVTSLARENDITPTSLVMTSAQMPSQQNQAIIIMPNTYAPKPVESFAIPKPSKSSRQPKKIAPAPAAQPSVPTTSLLAMNVLPQQQPPVTLQTLLSAGTSKPAPQPKINTQDTSEQSYSMDSMQQQGVLQQLLLTQQPTQHASNVAELDENLTRPVQNNTDVSLQTTKKEALKQETALSAAASPNSPWQQMSPEPPVTTPQGKTLRLKTKEERKYYNEHRRVCHVKSEVKRRHNIKLSFDTLHELLPSLSKQGGTPAKFSKAVILQKTVDYIRQLKSSRQQMQDEAEKLSQKKQDLEDEIGNLQMQLPATGVPVPRQKTDKMWEMYEELVRLRTLQNWKFWIFNVIIQPLFKSYNNSILTSSVDELNRTVMLWLDQQCSLVALRPSVMNSLRELSTTTTILTEPSLLPEHARRAVQDDSEKMAQ